jgi:hypothetical protein
VAVRRVEHAHYTKEQVEQHVIDSLEIAAAAALTEADRAALLPGIFEKLSGKNIVLEEMRMGGIDLAIRPQG